MRSFLLLAALAFCSMAYGQNFILGGGGIGFSNNETLNGVTNRFNGETGHDLGSFNILPGYELGFARYTKLTLVELKWGGEGKRNSSKVPGNFIENATVGWRYHYVNVSFGIKPYENKYFTAGMSLNFGKMRMRYSFGGDFEVTDGNLTVSSEIFIDYAVKFRWRRSNEPYLFRIRPYYQFFLLPSDLEALERGLNANPDVQPNQYLEKMGNFGIRCVVMIPVKPIKKRS